MDDTQDRSPVELLCDVLVYAPLGFALEAPKLLPELAAKGRNQVAAARTVGRLVVSQAAGGLGPLASSVLGGVLRGLSGSRDARQPAGPAPEATAPAGSAVALEEVMVVPEAGVAVVDPGSVAAADGASDRAAADGQLSGPASGDGLTPPPAARPRRPVSPSPRAAGADEPPPSGPAPAEEEPGDGLSGAPVEDDELPEPDLDAPRPAEPKESSAEADPPAPGDPAALAIAEYDSLAASQVVPRLASLSHDELTALRSYEAAHRGRRTILGRADQLLARASGAGA